MATKPKLLPSDELHFLRWFWQQAEMFIFDYGNDIDYVGAMQTYESEFGRAAPGDYKAKYL